MRRKFSKSYQTALLAYLKQKAGGPLQSAHTMGDRAVTAGLRTPDIAKLHRQIVVTEVLSVRPARECAGLMKQARAFFSEAIAPIERLHLASLNSAVPLSEIIETLSRCTVELAASNLELSLESEQRKAAEDALKEGERHYARLLGRSERLQEQSRQLARQILSAQEEERREISRELHDVIAQTLAGINVQLTALKKEASVTTRGLDVNIARTQLMVEKSVDLVHRFARDLRPAVLDDLGLIPALHSFMKQFTTRTGIRTYLTAFAGVEHLEIARRTVFFRVAQEALTNVERHAQASRVDVTLRKVPDGVCLKIKDDGKSFRVDRALERKGSKRLGLLGMRERLEMVGGSFAIESAPGKGTTIIAQIPMEEERGNGKGANTPFRSRPPMTKTNRL